MKTAIQMLVLAAALTLPLSAARAVPQIQAAPAGPSAAQLVLPGELSGMPLLAVHCPSRVHADRLPAVRELTPAQLSLQGEVIEDVLAPRTDLDRTPGPAVSRPR